EMVVLRVRHVERLARHRPHLLAGSRAEPHHFYPTVAHSAKTKEKQIAARPFEQAAAFEPVAVVERDRPDFPVLGGDPDHVFAGQDDTVFSHALAVHHLPAEFVLYLAVWVNEVGALLLAETSLLN